LLTTYVLSSNVPNLPTAARIRWNLARPGGRRKKKMPENRVPTENEEFKLSQSL